MRKQAELPIDSPRTGYRPLADRMRPQALAEFAGQSHLLAPGRPLHRLLTEGVAHSMVLWGPPGSGKTTLARLAAQSSKANFIALSAVVAGVKDIREAVDEAQASRRAGGPPTVLFLDEVHRFNKAQQDTFLPFVEDGTLVFIGATTENPSFELNSALLSRARVYLLKALTSSELAPFSNALSRFGTGLGASSLSTPPESIALLADAADGDARRALNLLEVAADLAGNAVPGIITLEIVREATAGGHRRFDKRGELFYDQISALHKSVRDSDADASLYWLCRMLDGGCDPGFIARRLVRMASEDIGNADPRALTLTLAAWELTSARKPGRGARARAGLCVPRARAEEQRRLYGLWGRHGGCEIAGYARRAVAPPKCADAPHEGNRLRQGLSLRARRAGCACARTDPFPGYDGAPPYYEPVPRGLELKLRESLERIRRDGESRTRVLTERNDGDA